MHLEIKIIEEDTEENRMLYAFFKSPVGEKLVEIGKEKYIGHESFAKGYDILNKFQVRDDDVFIMGHPKTGTSWLKEMVFLLVNNLDYNLEKSIIKHNFNDLEMFTTLNDQGAICEEFNVINEMPSPRCIGSHLIWSLLPEEIRNSDKNHKIIYIYRNPMDTCYSYYNFLKMLRGDIEKLENFCQLFMKGKIIAGPYLQNLLSFWNERSRKNLLIINYKDMKNDLFSVIKTASEFLNKSYTDDQITQLVKYLSFEKTKQRCEKEIQKTLEPLMNFYGNSDRTATFYKHGKEGAAKSEMSSKLIKEFDAWTKESFAGTGLTF